MAGAGIALKNLNDELAKTKALHQLASGQAIQIGNRYYDARRRHTKQRLDDRVGERIFPLSGTD